MGTMYAVILRNQIFNESSSLKIMIIIVKIQTDPSISARSLDLMLISKDVFLVPVEH